MDLKSLLVEIELDVRELKYLAGSFETLQNDEELKNLLQIKIRNAQGKLEEMLLQIDNIQPAVVKESVVIEEQFSSNEVSSVETVATLQPEELLEDVDETVNESEFEEELDDNELEDDEIVSKVDKVKSSSLGIIGEQLRAPGDLRRSISLNDSFRFSRELFDGDSEVMNRVLEQVSHMQSYDSAVAYLSAKIKLNEEDETVADLLFLLKKYFN